VGARFDTVFSGSEAIRPDTSRERRAG